MIRQWMKSWMQMTAAAGVVLITIALSACVWRTEHKVETVHKIDAHVVLDIRQIKEEGQQVEQYVRGESDVPPPVGGAEGRPVSMLAERPWYAIFDIASTAAAAEVSAEEEKAAIERRRNRAGEIERALTAGSLGENDHGYVSVLSGDLKALADAENRDRRTIYQAQAQRVKGGNGGKLELVEVVRAEQIRESVLKPGQKFQAPRDPGFFKAFQESSFGKNYPEAKPGAWLRKK